MPEAIIFDTEFTAWRGSMERGWRGPAELREVVQIGAVAIDVDSFEEVASFSVLIKPLHNPVLSDYLVALTRITNERLAAEVVYQLGVNVLVTTEDRQTRALR